MIKGSYLYINSLLRATRRNLSGSGVMKITSIILTLLLLSFQVNDEEYIYWSKSNKLKWSYFTSKTSSGNNVKGAYIFTDINCYADFLGNDIKVFVTARMQRCNSWVVESDKSDYLLNHEQRHFDLAEVYSRRIKKELNDFEDLNIKNDDFEIQFNATVSKLLDEFDKIQTQYDQETKHSHNKVKQTEWDKYIDRQLKIYEEYSEDSITIVLIN